MSTTVTEVPTIRQVTRLNIGCGPVQPEGWVNLDGSNRAKLASCLPWIDAMLVRWKLIPPTEFNRSTVVQDIRQGLRFTDDTVSVIYCGELLEHLTELEGQRFLCECFRILAPGGVLRIRVPDNYRFWKNYVTEYETISGLSRDQWNNDHGRWVKMFFRDICVRRPWLGSMGHFHKWMYDEVSLILAFQQAGFVEVERRDLHDSRISNVELVENRDDLIVEGIKPHN